MARYRYMGVCNAREFFFAITGVGARARCGTTKFRYNAPHWDAAFVRKAAAGDKKSARCVRHTRTRDGGGEEVEEEGRRRARHSTRQLVDAVRLHARSVNRSGNRRRRRRRRLAGRSESGSICKTRSAPVLRMLDLDLYKRDAHAPEFRENFRDARRQTSRVGRDARSRNM